MNLKLVGLLGIYMLITFMADVIPFFASIYIVYTASIFSILKFYKALGFFFISISTLLIQPGNWWAFQYPFIFLLLLAIGLVLLEIRFIGYILLDKRLKPLKRIIQ